MLTFNNMHPTKTRQGLMTRRNNSQTGQDASSVSTLAVEARRASEVSSVMSLLEEMGYLQDKKFCLQLAGHLSQHVGHLCAGSSSRTTVYELMMMSMRASELAKQIDSTDTN